MAARALALLSLVTLVAVLSALATALANLLAGDAGAIYALALTVPMALLVTFYARVLRPGHGGEAVAVGLALFILAVVVGTRASSTGIANLFSLSQRSVIVLLAAYCLFAALIPLDALSLVRGALSGYLVLGAMGLMAMMMAFAAPPLQVTPTTAFGRGGGPLLTGSVFPTVAIVLAAGTVSGFHALVASGPTARLVRRESKVLPVGFGAMLLTGSVALLVLTVTATLSLADLVAINTALPPEHVAEVVGTPPSDYNQLRADFRSLQDFGSLVEARPGELTALATGTVQVFRALPKVKLTWLPRLYRAVNVLAALLLFAALEAGVRAGWLLVSKGAREQGSRGAREQGSRGAGEQGGRGAGEQGSRGAEEQRSRRNSLPCRLVASSPPCLVASSPCRLVPSLPRCLIPLLVIVAWAGLSLGVSPRFTDPLVGVSSLLLAAGVLCLGTVLVMRLHSGRARLLALVTVIPALVILLIGLAGGILGIKELWPRTRAREAFKIAYQELPGLTAQQDLIPIERAWTIVREMSVDQAAEVYTSGGRDGLAQALRARFGDSVPQEGIRLANLVVGRARAVILWSEIQVAGMILAMVLALVLVGVAAARSRPADGETREKLDIERISRKPVPPESPLSLAILRRHLGLWLLPPAGPDVRPEPLPKPEPEEPAVQDRDQRRERPSLRLRSGQAWAFLAARALLFAISITLTLCGSYVLYRNRGDLAIAALFYAVALFCLRLALYDVWPPTWSMRQALTALGDKLQAHRWELLWLSLIFGIAIFFRVYRFGYFPPANGVAFEEAQAGGDAFKVLSEGHRPIEFPLTAYLPALSFALLGESTTTLRLPFLILGCLTIVPFYLLLRQLVDYKVALFGTCLLAVSRWHAVVSRIADELFTPIFAEALILYLVVKGSKTKEAKHFFWLGILCAYMLYAYTGYRVIPFLVLLLFIGRFFKAVLSQVLGRRKFGDSLGAVFRANWRPALAFAAAFVIVASPLYVVTRQGDRVFIEGFIRASASGGEAVGLSFPTSQALNRLKNALLIFTHKGEGYPALNLPGEPMLDPVSGVLFVLGVAYSLLTLFRPYRLWFLLWIAVVMLVGAVFPPNLYVGRFSNLIPIVFVFISFVVGDLSSWVDRRWGKTCPERSRRNKQRLLAVLLVALAIAALILNFRTFFKRQVDDPQVRRAYQDRVVALCSYITSLSSEPYVYLWDQDQLLEYVFLSSDYSWACHELRGEAVSSMEAVLPAKVQADQVGYVFVNPPHPIDELSQLISQFYPQIQGPSAIIDGEEGAYRIVVYLVSLSLQDAS
jgi:carbon starvation protein CstA